MNRRKILSLLMVGLSIYACSSYGDYKQVNVSVVDENGAPVSNALVSVSFDGGGNKREERQALTRDDGAVSVSGSTPYSVPIGVRKDGYYYGRYIEDDISKNDIRVEIVLRKKIDPRPMFARYGDYNFPVVNKKVGFDFEVGDWVEPFGSGKIVDILLEPKTNLIDRKNFEFTVEVSFPNEFDGVYLLDRSQLSNDSEFKFPHLAADSGYMKSTSYSYAMVDSKLTTNRPIAVVRTRTVSRNGEIESANYTKLYPPMELFGLLSTPGFLFNYFYNPTPNNRSLEFDVQKNLAGNTRFTRTIREP